VADDARNARIVDDIAAALSRGRTASCSPAESHT
jgi:hypothetical protein